MDTRIIDDLQRHCQEHSSFKQLAIALNWSEAQLSAFFAHKDLSLDSIIRVGFAMNLEIDVVFTPKSSSVDKTPA